MPICWHRRSGCIGFDPLFMVEERTQTDLVAGFPFAGDVRVGDVPISTA